MTNYITLAQAAEMLPTRPAVCTIWRWCTRGLHVRRTGQVVRLRCVFIGRQMFTTPDSVEEFIHRLTAARMGRYEPVIDRKRSPHARSPMTAAEAEEILREAGILRGPARAAVASPAPGIAGSRYSRSASTAAEPAAPPHVLRA